MNADFALPRHHECAEQIAASPERVFDFLDDPAHLTEHMSRSSWAMGGGRMQLFLDEGGGRRAGSKSTLRGSAFGLDLFLEEVVIERASPIRKVWETSGTTRLWVISHYRLGFEISALPDGSLVRVFIDYAFPTAGIGRLLGPLFASVYAKWCVRRMLDEARAHFARPSGAAVAAP
jgi:hypothetical protein